MPTRSSMVLAVPERFDVLIVGAGIVGTACAVQLAEAGLTIGILEAEAPGSGATAAGMGHIVVMDDSPAQLALTRYSQLLWDELAAEGPERLEYSRCGTIWVAAGDEEMVVVGEKRNYYDRHGIPSEILDEQALYQCEPQLRPGLAGGLLVPGDSVVYPPRIAELLLQRAATNGRVQQIRGSAVGVESGAVLLDNGDKIEAESIVLANGARSIRLLPDLPVRPKKGHLAITDRYPGFLRHQLVELGYIKNAHSATGDSVSFNVQPRLTGQLLIGSSRQPDIATRDIDYSILARMFRRCLEYLPGLADLSCVRVWTGLRAATPDSLPLIGPYEPLPGVWLATGHEGLGITTSLGTAKLLAAQMTGQRAPIALEPYLPSRMRMPGG